MEGLERILPAAAMHQVVPLRDEVDDGTAVVTLAKWHSAIHAPRPLGFERILGHRLVELLPVQDAQFDGPAFRALTRILHKALRISHGLPFPFARVSLQR